MDYARYGMLIDGEWTGTEGRRTYSVCNPATEEEIGQAAHADEADVIAAIDSAERAAVTWRSTPSWKRSETLRRIAAIIRERVDRIGMQVTLEIGKPLDQARGEVLGAADQFDWFADETRRIYGQTIESRIPNTTHHVVFEPVGIVAAFTPWNFPVALAARKIAPALAAGCTVVCRGPLEAPGALALLAECCIDAGLPAGSLTLLNGDPEPITDIIMRDARVRKVSFTGSVRVGKIIASGAAATLKKVTMELGGHAPVIVMDDVDIDVVASQSAAAKFRNSGQVCISPSRFFVMENAFERFTTMFAERMKAIQLGNGLEDGVDMGPLATERRRKEIGELVDDASSRGAELLAGGRTPSGFNRGWFYEPTALTRVPDDARMMGEEIFGPVAVINPVRSLEEAIKKSNSTELGLNAYAFTRSLSAAREISEGLQSGMVTINSFAPAMTEVPFGGVKASGYGREGGELGIREYLEAKSITTTYPG